MTHFPILLVGILLLTAFAAMARALSRLRTRTRIIQNISQNLSAVSGEDYFETLCSSLRAQLGFDYVLITERDPESSARWNTLTLSCRTGLPEPSGASPTEGEFFLASPRYFVRGARKADSAGFLDPLPVEGLISIPLHDTDGSAIGSLTGLNCGPLRNRRFSKAVLQGFAPWTACELRHRHTSVKLSQARQMSELILESIPIRVFWKDLESRYIGCNHQFATYLGYETPSAILGKSDFDLYADKEAQVHQFEDRRVLGARSPRGHYFSQHLCKDGSERVLWMNKVSLRNNRGEATGVLGIAQDITDHVRAEDALRDSERKLRDILNSSLFGVVVHHQGRPLFANEQAVRMSGYSSSEEWLELGHLELLVCPDDQARLQADFRRLCSGETAAVQRIFRTRHRSAPDALWLETHSTLVDWEGHKAVLTTLIDATSRKEAALKLQQQSRLMSTVLDAIPTPIFYKDAAGLYLGCNQAFADSLGKDKEAIIGKGVYDLAPKALADIYYRADREMLHRGGNQVYETKVRYADGAEHDVIFHKAVFSDDDGSIGGLVGCMLDISARKRAEDELRSAHRRLQDIIDFLPDATFVIDQNKKVMAWNKAMEELTGTLKEEILLKGDFAYALPFYNHRRPLLIDQVGKSDENIRKIYGDFERHGETLFSEIRFAQAGCVTRYLWASCAPLYDRAGNRTGAIETLRDITDRKHAELELSEAKAELEVRVHERTQQLQDLNFQLRRSLEATREAQSQLVEKEKFAALGALVAGVAHEINTPVGVGITAATHLRDRTAPVQEQFADGTLRRSELESFLQTVSEASEAIYGNLRRAADLVQSFKQVAVDQSSESRRRFRVKDYLEDVLLSLTPPMRPAGHRLDLECDPELTINSSPGVFSQILTNLVMNSIQHGFQGRLGGRMQLKVRCKEEALRLEFTDNGRGMNQAEAQRLFEPFFTTRRGQGGSGLGMHIVYNLVTRTLGGEIQCDSAPGAGVYFRIEIPLRDTEREAPQLLLSV